MADDTDLIEVDDADVQELFFDRGWTDGLPIVPPPSPATCSAADPRGHSAAHGVAGGVAVPVVGRDAVLA
ncbi:hypothetical protein JOF36_003485 [Pseudonocardia parietis]|uniref:Uncharacterized protein n=1 Tax=Pseudonocardia parietis TaxID=570936 RepID=A0ABS4VV44_9PSEU|nr:hypothetical protein [Pseudonocardia parietis]